MKLRPFEIALVAIFAILAVIAMILLGSYKPNDKVTDANITAPVTLWSTIKKDGIADILEEFRKGDKAYEKVSYRYVAPEDFDEEFVNALADQNPPDLVLMSHEYLVKHRSRLQSLSYESFPERDYRSLYIDGSDIFALPDGLYAFPVALDPLVMYWNRELFSNAGIILPPKTWEEVVNSIVPKLTQVDDSRKITLSAVALGEYRNVRNSFAIISTLLLQGGSSMVSVKDKSYNVAINNTINQSSERPFENTINFYSNFSNINNSLYSWNRSLNLDRDLFLSSDLAVYFGLASEGKELESLNPNLSFDVAEIPQGGLATTKRTYAEFYGFSIPKAAKNQTGAYVVMQALGGSAAAAKIASSAGLAPVHRSLVSAGSSDVYGRIAYLSAVYARGWLSPDRQKLDNLLVKTLDNVGANRADVGTAVTDAVEEMGQLY